MLENEQRKMIRDQIEDFNSQREIRTRIYVLRFDNKAKEVDSLLLFNEKSNGE